MRGLRPTVLVACAALAGAQEAPLHERVEHGFVENGGVKLHYAALGEEGPLVVLLHGFPDYWYTWRHQMDALAAHHRVVALDLRGYNRSDKPEGLEAYSMRALMSDVDATIRHFGAERAVVVGHDWGGAIAWQFAGWYPQRVERLVILNVPHPAGLTRELADADGQGGASGYAYEFQKEDAHLALTAEGLAGWVREPEARARYVEAFRRSDFEALLAYYKRNYPKPPAPTADGAQEAAAPAPPSLPRIQAPTLVLFGLQDRYLLPAGLNGTWDWIDAELSLVTFPDAGHFVQHDAAERVTETLVAWLER